MRPLFDRRLVLLPARRAPSGGLHAKGMKSSGDSLILFLPLIFITDEFDVSL